MKGFTLVELLVVITIIAILATVGLVMYGSAQKQARMAKRVKDLQALQTALELYYSVNKRYPVSSSWTNCNLTNFPTVDPALVPKYMPTLPTDPHSSGCYYYLSSSTGSEYKVRASCPGSPCDMSSSDYRTQPNLIDPARDGASSSTCSVVDTGTTVAGWAIYSSNNGVNSDVADTGNPACW